MSGYQLTLPDGFERLAPIDSVPGLEQFARPDEPVVVSVYARDDYLPGPMKLEGAIGLLLRNLTPVEQLSAIEEDRAGGRIRVVDLRTGPHGFTRVKLAALDTGERTAVVVDVTYPATLEDTYDAVADEVVNSLRSTD